MEGSGVWRGGRPAGKWLALDAIMRLGMVPPPDPEQAESAFQILRGRAAEVGTIEPEAAELTREMLKKGDVIVKYDGETLIDFDHLTRITRKHEVGDRLPVEVRRNGEPVEIDHRFPTSCSRYSAYFALAASSFFGMCSVGHPSTGV